MHGKSGRLQGKKARMQENPDHSGQKPCRPGRRGWIPMHCQAQGEMMALTALGYACAFPHLPSLWSSLTQAEGKMCTSRGPSFPSSAPVLDLEPKALPALPSCPPTPRPGAEPGPASTKPLGGQTRRKRPESNERKRLPGLVLLVPRKAGAAAEPSPARSGPKSRRYEQHR